MLQFLRRGPTALAAWWLRPAAPQAVPVSIHVLLWSFLLGANTLRLIIRRLMDGPVGWSWPLMLSDLLLTAGTYAGLFYITWLVIVPDHQRRQRPVRFLLVILLAVGLTSIVRYSTNLALGLTNLDWTQYHTAQASGSVSESFKIGLKAGYQEAAQEANARQRGQTTGANIVPAALLVMLLGIYLRLGNDYQSEQRRRQQAELQRQDLEKQHLAAELSLLKAQINPHFLFNTLNNIYSLAGEQDPDAPAATAVLQLASLMRYQLYESNTETVPLSKEVEHLRHFLSLQQLRLPGAGPECLRFQVWADEAALQAHSVSPMLLLPLVENAFKHGDLTARPHAVELELQLANNQLTFQVRNRRRAPRPGTGQPGGVGLTNLRRRLLLLYPLRHGLRIDETADEYCVTLTLASATPPPAAPPTTAPAAAAPVLATA